MAARNPRPLIACRRAKARDCVTLVLFFSLSQSRSVERSAIVLDA